jgi:hypothetical protein
MRYACECQVSACMTLSNTLALAAGSLRYGRPLGGGEPQIHTVEAPIELSSGGPFRTQFLGEERRGSTQGELDKLQDAVHNCLARQVAPHDHGVRTVETAGVQELTLTDI